MNLGLWVTDGHYSPLGIECIYMRLPQDPCSYCSASSSLQQLRMKGNIALLATL